MHHLDLGLFHYQIEYTRQLIKDQHGNSFVNKIDHRLATIPRFSGLKIFSNGIQSIARLTASEYRDLMKVMLFVVDNLYNQIQITLRMAPKLKSDFPNISVSDFGSRKFSEMQ